MVKISSIYPLAILYRNPDSLKFEMKQPEGEPLRSTANVVYNEILLLEDFKNYNQDQNLQNVIEENKLLEDEI